MMMLLASLRGAAAVAVLVVLTGGLPRIVQAGLAVVAGWASAVLAGATWFAALPGTSTLSGALPDGALWLVAGRELAIGATLGLAAALPLLAAAIAGRLVDFSAGARSRGPYAPLFALLGAAVFVGIDGHVAVISAVASSFHDMPALGSSEPRALATLAALLPRAAQIATPWLVTAAVVEIAAGVAVRVGGRAAGHGPLGAATPAALVMMTATLVGTLAVAIAALVRGG
jgi:type III secretory pathway component EscT